MFNYKNSPICTILLCTIFSVVLQILLLVPNIALANFEAPVLVKEAVIKKSEFYEKYIAVGQCKAENSRTYHAKIDGIIDSIVISQGQKVKKGDILITIDKQIAETSKAKAEASNELAKTSYERDLSLLNKKFISKEVLDKSKVMLEGARADLSLALNKYEDMIIIAPFDGYIGVVHAQVGSEVSAGDYLFTIISNSEKAVFVELPENLSGRISNESLVFVLDNERKKIEGKIFAVSNYLNDNGTITAKLIFPSSTKVIHGSYVESEFIFNHHFGLALPEKTILKNNQGNFVYQITDDKKIKQVYIKTGVRANNLIEIFSSELKEGDMVVLEGLTKITEKSSVDLIKDKAVEN